MGGMTYVASLKFQGREGKNCLKFCIMQCNAQSATIKELIALTCCDKPIERGYFCQMITYRTSSFYNRGRPVNVKQGEICAMGKVGEDRKKQKGGILIYFYKFAVIG